jgi:hypothetical protein
MSLLPGMFPAGVAAIRQAAALTTLSQVASASSTGETITGPAGIQAGDLLVLWDVANGLGATLPTTVVPTDFDIIVNVPGGEGESRGILSAKIADGSEASASLTGMNGAANNRKALYVFRGNIPIAAYMTQDVGSQQTDGNPAAQTVNASGGAVPLIVLGGYATRPTGGSVNPRTFTVGGVGAKDGEVSAGASTELWLAYKLYNASPADVVVDMDDEGQRNFLVSCYIECS